MLAIVSSAVVEGVFGRPVSVEVHVSNGLPGFTVVGLPDASCREARDRVRAALLSSGLEFPRRKVTVNLAPSGIRKHGAGLDLPIALALLVASDQLPAESIQDLGAAGELGLDGSIRPIAGLVSIADATIGREIVVPAQGAVEAAVVRPDAVRGAGHLREVFDWLDGQGLRPSFAVASDDDHHTRPSADLADVRGQPLARYALELAAAGGHHLLMVGPPGGGKTMLANRLAGLLPALDADDALVCTRVHSVCGLAIPAGGLIRIPPFRAPHHGISDVGMIGGGSPVIRPGEVSCSHAGVLFLDEMGEFPLKILDALRQPAEDGVIRVTRASGSVVLPARFQLVGAMNPCPCGLGGGADGLCRCSDASIDRYVRRLSAPLLDRFDLRIDVVPPDPSLLLAGPPEESSDAVRERVAEARRLSRERGFRSNSDLPDDVLDEVAPLEPEAESLLEKALKKGELTGRGLRRIRTVARTIVDLDDGGSTIGVSAVARALAMRSKPLQSLRGAA